MADQTQQVIIEFISDTSQLSPAVDKLTALGAIDEKSAAIFKATNEQLRQRNALLASTLQDSSSLSSEITGQQAIYNKLVSSVKNLSGASKEAVQTLLKLSTGDVAGFFQKAGTNVDNYVKSLQNANDKQDDGAKKILTLRTQLLQLTNQLAELTAAGQQESQQFVDIATKAAALKNAIREAQITVADLGSHAPQVKLLGTAVQGIAGGFTAATGAAALFGGKGKDLEEVLVRVNAVMAINQGLSQAINVLRDEAAINTAKVIIQEKINNAQIAIENGLQSQSVIVRGAATVAQYALNLAMSLNPISLLVIGIAAFVTGILLYTSSASKAAAITGELNAALEETGKILDAGISGVNEASKRIISDLNTRNAKQSEIQQAELIALQINNKDRLDAIKQLNALIIKDQENTNSDVEELVKKAKDQLEKLENDKESAITEIHVKENEIRKQLEIESLQDQESRIQASLSLSVKNSDKQFALQRQLAVAKSALDIKAAGDDAAKVVEIQAALARQIKDINIAEAAEAQKTIAAGLTSALIKSQNESRAINDRVSQEEINRQKTIITEQAEFDVRQEGLTQGQKQAIRDAANQKNIELQRSFDKQSAIEVLDDEQSRTTAELSQIKLSEQQKLSLRIDNIITAASIEIEQNRGKADKIKEIEAKRDKDIADARLASIQKELTDELALTQAQQAPGDRAIEEQLAIQQKLASISNSRQLAIFKATTDAQKLSLNQQLALIDVLTQHKLDADQKEIDANKKALDEGLINEEDYTVKNAVLIDKQTKDFEDGEKRKRDLSEQTKQKQLADFEQTVSRIGEIASSISNVIAGIYSNMNDAQQNAIDAQRQNIQDLQDSGAINAKEASDRNKQLDREQRKIQHDAAVRDKQIAIFNATISLAEAVIKAYSTTGPISGAVFAAIVAAIGGAEIATIAAKPIPAFGKGKKNRYQGFGQIGETGTELLERNGRMYVADKPTITWLGADDKVYNPVETAAIIEDRIPSAYYPGNIKNGSTTTIFDYDRLGKAVGDNIPEYGIGFDGDQLYEWARKGNSFTKYLNRRRKWQ